jgi:drug/metabolite transporter (DMT)-like permease
VFQTPLRFAVTQTSRGTWLALVTVAAWAVLPITLKIASRHLDPSTLTWYRFVISAVILGGILAWRHELPAAAWRAPRSLVLVCVATLGLAINYVLYLWSFTYVSPTVANGVTQIGPLLLMLGGVLLFREQISTRQKIGVALLLVGLLLFFNRRLSELAHLSGPAGFGTLILIIAGVCWAAYALAQKALLRGLGSPQILLLLYVGCALLLLPLSAPSHVTRLSGLELTMLGLSALNTLVAYGALAEGLKLAGAARVGSLLALVPVVSLFVTWMTNHLSPGFFEPDMLNAATIVGAAIVTAGSALTAQESARSESSATSAT